MESICLQSKNRRHLGLVLALAWTFMAAACAKPLEIKYEKLVDRTSESVGCASFEDEFWDGLYRIVLSKESFPSPAEVREAFDQALEHKQTSLSPGDRQSLAEELSSLYELLALSSVHTLEASDEGLKGHTLEILTSLEMGDRTTPEKAALQEKIRAQFDRVKALSGQTNTSCDATPEQPVPSFTPPVPTPRQDPTPAPDPELDASRLLLSSWKATRHPAVFGGLKTLATAYQSCEAGVVDEIKITTPNIRGIKVTGRHPNGVGNVREISDLQAFLKSHYYLSQYRRPAASCFDILAKPLIYDYGGKPAATADVNSVLDVFTNAGSGSKELGIDCSGYVYSALATAGLKLKSSGRLKAVGVSGVNAKMFMNPQSNGLTCLDHAVFEPTASLKPGDIIASGGHVVMVESVGADPFGIKKAQDASDCTPEQLLPTRFDFTILQSSPSKGAIGINRMSARDYLVKEGGSIALGLVDHAVTACQARFKGTRRTGSLKTANVVRHLGTSSCLDTPIRLAQEECVASCPVESPLTELP